jgi:predicted Na+-dependent transporter
MNLLRLLILDAPATMLAWLGRQGARALAALVFIGIAAPSLGAALKPFVTEAVFMLLCISFVRVDAVAFRAYLKRPAIVLAATVWTSFLIPVLFGVSCLALGVNAHSPDLFLGLLLQAIASPMMATPTMAALMGLDATLVLVTMVASTALIPFTAPLFAYAFIGNGLALSPMAIGLKLLAILAGSALVGVVVRRMVNAVTIERHKDKINGFNILVLFVFVAALMENVAARIFVTPLIVVGYAALAVVVFFALLGVTALLFVWTGRERALAIALMTSQRNMGLMVAATGGILPDLTWLYFALSQIPIYLSPQLLQSFAARLAGRTRVLPSAPASNARNVEDTP